MKTCFEKCTEALEKIIELMDKLDKEEGKEKIRVDFPMSKQLYDDVELLKELSFNLRYKKIKIVEEE
jgi:hypothetical protein